MTARWLELRFETLTTELVGTASRARDDVVAALTPEPDDATVWLAWSVIVGRLPLPREVTSCRRMALLEGTGAMLDSLIARAGRAVRNPFRTVRVVRDRVVIDVRDITHTGLGTGIQRVTRETIRRWDERRDPLFVTWGDDFESLRELTPVEKRRAMTGQTGPHRRSLRNEVIVPRDGWFVLPELSAEAWRAPRTAALLVNSGARSGVIGFDTVPLTSSETAMEGMPAHFALYLDMMSQMDRIATISDAAGAEYRGWRRMLSGVGEAGPDIRTVFLPSSAGEPSDAAVEDLKREIDYDPVEPLIVVVGSHEPRKNHLSVLAAAEKLWREGRRFQLLFIGGNSWNSQTFTRRVTRLAAAGYPVRTQSAISDSLLWAAYRLARFTVFPSFNEGFGLPVAESLASGTPVVTSQYGSLKDIADAGGGAVLVDPYDDADVARGMRLLLDDDAELARLQAEARTRPARSWDDYESELWDYFVG